MGLGEAAADEQAVAVRQAAVAQGVEEDERRARALERFEVVLIVEAEGLVAGDRDSHVPLAGSFERRDRRRQPGRARRDIANARKIDAPGDGAARGFDDRVAFRRLAGRRQAEMPLAHDDALIAADRAEDGNVGVAIERLPQLPGLPLRSDLVENDSGDPRLAVEGGIALHQRGDAASHAGGVDDEHDRRAEELRQRGARIGALDVDAVVQSLVSFDQGDVGAPARCARTWPGSRRRSGC